MQKYHDLFMSNIRRKHPHVEILEMNYVSNSDSYTKSKCNKCNNISEWIRRDYLLSSVKGCKHCSKAEIHLDARYSANEKWKAKCSKKFSNKFDYSKVDFKISSNSKVTITCPIHGEFLMTRDSHFRSKLGYPVGFANPTSSRGIRPDDKFQYYKNKLLKFENDIEILNLEYNSYEDSKLTYKCRICEKIHTKSLPTILNLSNPCDEHFSSNSKFYLKVINNVKIWKEKCSKKFNNKFDYSKVPDYCSDNEYIIIICPIHGEIKTTRSGHLNSDNGCNRCSGHVINNEDFINTCKGIYGDKYSYEKTNYKYATQKVIVTCPEHGDFSTYPLNFTRMVNNKYPGCVYCNKHELYTKTSVYTFKLKNYDLWKVGISINDVKTRYTSDYNMIDESTINQFVYSKWNDAHRFEEHILNEFKDFRNYSKIFKTDEGNTELLKCNPLEYMNSNYKKFITADPDYVDDSNIINQMFSELISNIDSRIKYTKIDDDLFTAYKITDYDIVINYVTPYNKYSNTNQHNALKVRFHNISKVLTLYSTNDFNQNVAIIKNSLKLNSIKVFARNCEIKIISANESKMFLNTYHLQKDRIASIRLGLFHNDKLVQVMTFGKSMFHKNPEYVEIYRLCSKADYTIVGGASKLLKYFERNLSQKYTSIITYADGAISKGNVYKQLGFEFLRRSDPGYFYIHSKTGLVLSRYQCYKTKLLDSSVQLKYGIIDEIKSSDTEFNIMTRSGYNKILTPGNLLFKKEILKI